MFLFWHEGGLFLGSPPWRSTWGLAPTNCDTLIAAGVPVLGKPGQANELFVMLAPVESLVSRVATPEAGPESAPDYSELIDKWGL